MKRALFFFLLLVSTTMVACGAEATAVPGYCQENYKCPAIQEHPQVLQAAEQIWRPTAAAATATHAAGATQAASYAATTEAVEALLSPVTPTPAPARPKPYPVQPGDVLGIIMQQVTGCSIEEVAVFNHLPNINSIQAGQTLNWPDNCRAVE